MIKKIDLLKKLDKKNIDYKIFEHEPFYTVADSNKNRAKIEGAHTKNLFLKNKKNQFILFSCDENSIINLKSLSKAIKVSNLSFAKADYLARYLGTQPGSVSPYGLLNDFNNVVDFYLEEFIYKNAKINFHPLINTSTLTIRTDEFISFMLENKIKINIFSLNENRVIKVYE